jgi:hypothetical protein
MSKRALWSGLVAALLPATVGAQGVAIDHNAVGCIVAGHYPKMNACFAPSANVARGRVYFRAEGTPNWYFVDMKSDASCFAGILPKPKKTIKKMNYYVEATDKNFAEARTAEYAPIVVEREGECKDTPVAPFLNNATVTVGAVGAAPAVPVGFVVGGGLSAGVITAGVVGLGLAATGTAVALSDGGTDTPTTVPGTSPPVTNPPITSPATTTTTTTTLRPVTAGFNAVFKILPNPPEGKEPLQVTFDMCDSTGTDLRFTFVFEENGEVFRGIGCSATRVYTLSGPTVPTILAAPATTPPQTAVFPATNCVIDASGRRECRDYLIKVTENQGLTVNSLDSTPASRRLAWASQLDVDGASGQVVVNGEAASFAGRGRSTAVAMGRRGENRVEAQLVQAAGRPGTWRFDLASTGSLAKGSLRVIAGDVALITPDAVVFALKGNAGERVVFTFRTGN